MIQKPDIEYIPTKHINFAKFSHESDKLQVNPSFIHSFIF